MNGMPEVHFGCKQHIGITRDSAFPRIGQPLKGLDEERQPSPLPRSRSPLCLLFDHLDVSCFASEPVTAISSIGSSHP